MARTKGTKKDKPQYNGRYAPWGGHLFFPPKSCKFAFTVDDGGRWCDLGCCGMCDDEPCEHRSRFLKMKPLERRNWLTQKGVKGMF